MTLEDYLTKNYPTDQQDIVEAERTLKAGVKIFEKATKFDKDHAWPYTLIGHASQETWKFSTNTTAMIVNTLLRYRGHFFSKPNDPFNNSKANLFEIPDARQNCTSAKLVIALDALLKNIWTEDKFSVESTTYGEDDIFTLAWLAELIPAKLNFSDTNSDVEKIQSKWENFSNCVSAKIDEKLQNWNSEARGVLFEPREAEAEDHSFPLLRLVQAARKLGKTPDFIPFYKYFESSLHEQLSFSSIPDSRFDPAELMFCLEGMLLCQPSGVDRTIFDRVIEVLSVAQNQSAFWRPVKPFLTNKRGMVLFPVSVEVANSLMRCCSMFDGGRLHDTYSSKAISLLRRYWQWLRSRAVTEPATPIDAYMGWHSEHVNQTETIHLWETSQVLDFLMSYRNMLYGHIARTTLVLSRVKQEVFDLGSWDKLKSQYEPVGSLDPALQTYDQIGKEFVTPRIDGHADNYSMLLYGPPGTGKTTVAKSIAQALGYRMVTVTVSDFLASGGAQVESRAKDIFAMLMAQPACVVLFDEVDHFLLDRDSERYAKQETLFQFMTPGMLTKFADLRQAERVLFIVATNYEDRIDPAIKRTGRIDRKYLVLPPDANKRYEIIKTLCENKPNLRDMLSNADCDQIQRVKDSSLFLGYGDLKAAVQAFNLEATADISIFVQRLRDRARTISLEAYQSRFPANGENMPVLRETPAAEFLGLVALASEKAERVSSGRKALNNAQKVMQASNEDQFSIEAIKNCDTLGLHVELQNKIFNVFLGSE